MFDRHIFDKCLEEVAKRYEKSAPTVEQWCDFLSAAKDDEIRLSDIHLLRSIRDNEGVAGPHFMANLVYHHNHRLGRDVAGHAGF